ncbi:hypothetical protein ABK040_006247 [Willaertia magna]
MPSNNNMNINNNNNNNDFNFIDETGKTREKCRKQRRMALLNIHNIKLRKQLQNNNLLINYFEWNNYNCCTNHLQVMPNIYQYNLANNVHSEKSVITKRHVPDEIINQQLYPASHVNNSVTSTVKEEQEAQPHLCAMNNNLNIPMAYLEQQAVTGGANNNIVGQQEVVVTDQGLEKRTILISEEFGLKLDLEDFIQSLKDFR